MKFNEEPRTIRKEKQKVVFINDEKHILTLQVWFEVVENNRLSSAELPKSCT